MLVRLFLLLGFFIVSFGLSAAHIVGGDVTYTCISSNPVARTTTFTVTYTI
jgi:hypothetical protein